MEEWVKLDSDALNESKLELINGVEINVMLSPHDVPRFSRTYYDKDLDRLVVELQYLEEERWVHSTTANPHITFRIGKQSQRLLGIELDVKAMEAESDDPQPATKGDSIPVVSPPIKGPAPKLMPTQPIKIKRIGRRLSVGNRAYQSTNVFAVDDVSKAIDKLAVKYHRKEANYEVAKGVIARKLHR